MEYLQSQGVRLDLKNSMGETPLDLADEHERYLEAIERERADGDPEKLRAVVRKTETTDAIRKLMGLPAQRAGNHETSTLKSKESGKMNKPTAAPGRRTFMAAAGAAAAATANMTGAEPASFPIIDTHLHLYDPTRPQGAPFPKTPNPPPFLPRDYQESRRLSASRAALWWKRAHGWKTTFGF